MGRVFKPMLADRVTDLNNIERLMKNKPFCVETKYDGERMQVSLFDQLEIQCFDRRGRLSLDVLFYEAQLSPGELPK